MNPWLAALLAVTALRLAVAAFVPLAPDEAYYWVWSRTLQAGYLDHPPMIALFIRAGTLLAGEGAFGIRLVGPLAIAVASVLLARAADDLFPARRPGVWAAALFNATTLVGIGSIVATPDLPLLVFWTAAVWALARLHATGDGRWWLAVGLLAGCALASKYTAVLLGAGVVAWLVFSRPAWRWWRDWRLYGGGVLAMLTFAPVVVWNATHGWASFAKQGGRAGSDAPGVTLRYLSELLGAQLGAATPLVFVLCVAGMGVATMAWARRGEAAPALLAALVLPGAALFLWQATGSRVQGNWPAILYPAACIAAAACAPRRLDGWRRPAVAVGAAMTLAVYVQSAFAPLPLPRRQDPTLARLGGWDAFAAAVEAERARTGAAFVAAEEYGLAAQLALRLPAGVTVVALDPRWALFDLPRPAMGVTGLLVQSERRHDVPFWPGAEPGGRAEGPLLRSRRGIEAERYRTFRVTTRPDMPPAALLPRPLP
ncbi:glycosyltransferase family 39 protein [Falsiroseomonas oryzae]|uniref:glycosyltransferase family 39 protein n=1 Tax=Falsiroseomonas oryzae TaxID=2766473 RepID=UPI0022EA7D58|nr:glycosyltransferase family 39 protein [Roseomonas sp. MO-31]